MNRPSWQDRAACKGQDLAIWFPEYPSGRMTPMVAARVRAIDDQAKAVCATCPVLEQCREWATTYPEIHGTWAGMTAPERALGRSSTRPTCGTRRGYMDHWWNHEEACDPCKAAQTAQSRAVKEQAKTGRSAA